MKRPIISKELMLERETLLARLVDSVKGKSLSETIVFAGENIFVGYCFLCCIPRRIKTTFYDLCVLNINLLFLL